MAALSFTTGVSPTALLDAPPEVFDAFVDLWEEAARRQKRKALHERLAGRFGKGRR